MAALTTSDSEREPTSDAGAPGATAELDTAERRWLVAPVVLAVAAIAVALVLPLAPVRVNDPVLSWPLDPSLPRSSLALFMPYRPLQLDVELPCQALRGTGAPDAPEVAVFSTYPPGPDRLTRGLTVLAQPDGFRVTSNGRDVYRGPVPSGDCTVQVATTTGSTTVLTEGHELATRRMDPPQVTAFATDLSPEAALGMAATAHADARFESSPTAVKRLLSALHLLLVGGCLWLLWRGDRSTHADGDRPSTAPATVARLVRAVRPRLPDAAVLSVLAVWTVIGPFTDDDGYYAAMSRGSSETGYVGNYYHWFNAPEAPFELVQRLLLPWVSIGHSTVWLRLPSLVAVLGVWMIVTRGVLPRLLARPIRATEQWLTAIVLLGWALPYGIGVRPEPWVALATVAVLGLVLRAVDTQRLVPLGVAAALGASAVAITPSGLMALTPLVAYGRPLYRILRARPGGIWRSTPTVVACATMAVAVIFVDASLGAVREATRIHDEIGPSLQWWQENTRYNYLFSFISMGSFAKRLPVLLAFAMVFLALVLRERAGNGAQRQSSRAVTAGRPAFAFALSIGALWLTPSKWTHHFGALIGLGTVVTVLMLADLPATLRGHRVSRLSMAGITFVFSVVVALSFAGPNAWFGYSQYGVSEYLSPRLSSPWLWILAGLAVAAVAVLVRTRRREGLALAIDDAPVVVVLLALLLSVGLCIGTFVHSAVKLRGTWSIAKENTDHLTGSSCGMGNYTQVLTYGKLTPTGSTEPFFGNGFSHKGAVYPPPVTPAEAGLPMWGSYVDGFGPGREWYTGEYVTPWYELGRLDDRSDISVLVTGRLYDGNTVTVEYAKRDESPLGQRVLRDYESTAGWRELVAADTTLAPAGTELLRLRLNDASVDAGGWLATTAPRLRTGGESLTDLIGSAPTLADWPIAVAFPCLRAAKLQHGLVEAPAYVLNSDFLAAHNSRDEQQGGTFVPAFQAANGGVIVPSRVEGMPGWITRWLGPWGTLTQYVYPYPADGFRLEIRHRTMSGADWSYQQPIVKPVEDRREQDRQGTDTTDR